MDYTEGFREQTGELVMSFLEREIAAIQAIKEIADDLGGVSTHVGAALKGFSELAYHNIETKSYDTPFLYEERDELLKALEVWRERANRSLYSEDSTVEYYRKKAEINESKIKELIEQNDILRKKYERCQLLMDFLSELNETE